MYQYKPTTLGCILFLAISASNQCGLAQQPASQGLTAQIKQVKLERLEVLRTAVDVLKKGFQQGVHDFDSVNSMQLEYLQAQLDLAESVSQRIRILGAQIALAQKVLESTETRHKHGMMSMLDVLRAKSTLLRIKAKHLEAQQELAASASNFEQRPATAVRARRRFGFSRRAR